MSDRSECNNELGRVHREYGEKIATLRQSLAASEAWKQSVIDACVVNFLSWDENDPRKTLANLIAWECKVALDPKVSKEAQQLITASEAREVALREALEMLYSENADYIRLNHLGDVHHNRSMQLARDAIASTATHAAATKRRWQAEALHKAADNRYKCAEEYRAEGYIAHAREVEENADWLRERADALERGPEGGSGGGNG